MKNKKIGLVLFSTLIIMVFSNCSKVENDNWLKEDPKIRYSEKRENEVWGKTLNGHSPEIFYGTPLYDLAKEMTCFYWFRSDKKIEELIMDLPQNYINHQDAKLGLTIGHFALIVSDLKAVRLLLDRGLNPNLMDKSGNAIIIDINSPFISRLPEGLETLQYMIKKGADVNLYSLNAQLHTPLIEAANSNFQNVKLLIAAGANPHFIDKSFASPFESPLSAALVNRRMEITNYLIFEQKVDFRTIKNPARSKFHPGDYVILYRLRELNFDLNTKDYKQKMKLVAYLKTQGLDYWKIPIPENISSNPDFTKEYLSRY